MTSASGEMLLLSGGAALLLTCRVSACRVVVTSEESAMLGKRVVSGCRVVVCGRRVLVAVGTTRLTGSVVGGAVTVKAGELLIGVRERLRKVVVVGTGSTAMLDVVLIGDSVVAAAVGELELGSRMSVVETVREPRSVFVVVVVVVGASLPSVSHCQSRQHSSSFERTRAQPSPGGSL